MNSATPRDIEIRFPSPTVVSASAGSGKTYSLAMRFAQFLLSPVVPHHGLPHLLAMTFTNAAAGEMRQRVIRFLKEAVIARPEDSRNLRFLQSLVSLDPDTTRDHAATLLDEIFEQYDDFQVRTIDSFIARAFKASALEAGYLPDFELVKQQGPLIEAAFDRYVRSGSRRAEGLNELKILTELVGENANRSSFDWNPFARIVDGSAAVLQQIASRPAELDQEDSTGERDGILESLRGVAREMSGLQEAGDLPLRKIVKDDIDRVLAGDWRKALRPRPDEGPLLKSGKKKPEGQDRREIEALFERFNDLRADLAVADAAAYYWPFVRALGAVAADIRATKIADGKFSVDDVNRLLWQSLAEGAAPSIYITLGTRLYHYLIDEFQDTSPIQWAALKVLVENACAEDGTFYSVGDTKQSIYSFRGADWQIMQRLLHGEERINAQPCLTASLDTNYRSDGEIVRFVETVFRNALASPDFGAAAQLSGLDHCAQTPLEGRENTGHVEVLRVRKDPVNRPEADAIIRLIDSARSRNYPLGSIAILAQTNSQVLDIGGWLNRAGIGFLSYSNLDLRKRPVVMEILSLLSWLDSPIDDLAFSAFLLGDLFARFMEKHLNRAMGDELRRFVLGARRRGDGALYTKFRTAHPGIWEQCFAHLLAHVGYLPGYDILCEVFKTFDVFSLAEHEQTALAGFLDAVKVLEANGSTSLKDLLEFAGAEEGEEASDMWNLASQKKPDAVTVMTVHKAKGLQFPVLIVLLTESRGYPGSMRLVENRGMIKLLHVTKPLAACHPDLQRRYDEDQTLGRADALNRLYVALTRAVHELYVILVEGEDRKFPSTVIPDYGDATRRPNRATDEAALQDSPFLTPHTHTLGVMDDGAHRDRMGFAETRRGDLVHRILSRIQFIEEDPGRMIASLMADEEMSPGERSRIEDVLTRFVGSAEVQPLFVPRPGTIVMNEKDFLSRNGALYRMDRVHIDNAVVTVVDYKTGGEEYQQSHRQQVLGYLDIMRDLYPGRTLNGIIAYVDRRKIVEVRLTGEGNTGE